MHANANRTLGRRQNRLLSMPWTLATWTGLLMLCCGCRTIEIEIGDRVRRVEPGQEVPRLESGARYWILMDDVRFRQLIESIQE